MLIEQDQDAVFVAEVPALPGCISQGSTRQVALDHVKEAISAYRDGLNKHDEPIPSPVCIQ
ncbi:MAG: type II toxin-antitoxin system HicB family antitoxin [Thermodesulfobacteriota bacterium]